MVKRFYKEVSVQETSEGYKILCDNKPLKCGCKADLALPTRVLADMVAEEWQSQSDEIKLQAMPVTNFLTAVLSLDDRQRAKIVAELTAFIDTDLLFYRAEYPANLVARQDEKWTPVIVWANKYFGTSFQVTNNILPIKQSFDTVNKIKQEIEAMDDTLLLGFFKLAAVDTSVLLGFATIKGFLDAGEAFALSRLEENFQNEMWGQDKESEKAKCLALTEAENTAKILKSAGYIK